jgi:dipeptidase D
MEISALNPQLVWKHFYALTRIPRPSGHTAAVAQYLVEFGKKIGVEAFIDKAGNVVMRKAATPGFENLETAILQAHMDMVPQPLDGPHNFETDPIGTHIEGEWVYANGTTLGADDGMGVAAAMAILEDDKVEHGPIEVLITADEETGMFGARGLEAGTLKGKYLLNLDSETEGVITIGCAGGQDVEVSMEYDEMDVNPEGMKAYKISMDGMRGGHSGLEICEGRANANKLMARLLSALLDAECVWICSWTGGTMRNAIPRSGEAVVLVPCSKEAEFKTITQEKLDIFNEEFITQENGKINIELSECDVPAKAMPDDVQLNLVNAILAAHDGVLRYIPTIPDIVETSSNLAIVKAKEGKIEIGILARSSSDTMKAYLCESLACCFRLAGMEVELTGGYGGWQPNTSSPLVANMSDVYEKLYGKKPVVEVCHAGLECGIIGVTYPEMDMASFGPTLESPHTPSERCFIPSVEKFYNFLVEMLKHIPSKA